MSDRGSLKVVELSDDARFNPELCVERLLEDMREGRVSVDRLVIVVVEHTDIQIRSSGPGMDSVGTAVGLLQLAMVDMCTDILGKFRP